MRTGALSIPVSGQSPHPDRDSAPASLAPACLPLRAGIGLKPQHFQEVVDSRPDVGFFEVHAENYLVDGGPMHAYLTQIRECYALSLHGVGLSLGGEGPLDPHHMQALKGLIDRYQPAVFSEHLAWSSHGGAFLNDLLPLPYDWESLDRVCRHVDEVQHALGRRILLENPSTYVEFVRSTMSEAEFLSAVVARTGCGLLLDINNAYVSAINHGRDSWQMLAALPLRAIEQIHLAGHAEQLDSAGSALFIDHHGCKVQDPVWTLYERFIAFAGGLPTLIEWDNDVPSFEILQQESRKADAVLARSSDARARGAG